MLHSVNTELPKWFSALNNIRTILFLHRVYTISKAEAVIHSSCPIFRSIFTYPVSICESRRLIRHLLALPEEPDLENSGTTGWTIGVLGFDPRRGLRIFLFTTASRTALGPTQPPIQWVPGALSLGLKRPGRKADHSCPSSAEVKECVELYLHSPNTPSWYGF
jgi:hypothetical protein